MSSTAKASSSATQVWTHPAGLYEGYIFDLDGTIYLEEELLTGAKRLVNALRAAGKRVVFLSNNPTHDLAMYAHKLDRLGIPTPQRDIITTIQVTLAWLRRNAPDAVVFPIGEAPLLRALSENGFRISNYPSEIDIVIASYDRTLTWAKLQVAFEALWYHRRARLIATNLDRYCTLKGGRAEVDAGAVVAALENATQLPVEVNCGKPSSVMINAVTEAISLKASDCVVVGDRHYTDIRMGIDAGMASALVLTGETTSDMASALEPCDRPTYVLDRIDRLIPKAMWKELGWTEHNA